MTGTAGAALAAATLVTGAASAASAATSGLGTTTDISMTVNGSGTTSTVDFDRQPTVELDFNVGNDGSAGITGTFTVIAGDQNNNNDAVICDNVTMHGFSEGDCTIPDGALTVGPHTIFAEYSGDGTNDPSASPLVRLTVTKEPTTTTLGTVSRVPYGQEGSEVFTITTGPRTSGAPTGNLEVLTGDQVTTWCQVSIDRGSGNCSPFSSTNLFPGTYQFIGFYPGDSTFSASISDPQTVTITPGVTTTTLSLSSSAIGFGQQQGEQITVQVTPVGSGTPSGQVVISAEGTDICTAILEDDTATCSLGTGQLPIGSYQVAATYSGDPNFASTSATPRGLTITGKSIASASLRLSTAKVTFGQEQTESLNVTVTGQVSGIVPAGQVTVKAGSATVCTVTLAAGQGSCALGASKLRPGAYHLVASYGGNVTYGSASSASVPLTVAAEPTSTSLTLSKAKVKSGHEQAEHLTVAVKPSVSGAPSGKVTIKSGSVTVCTITLKKSNGSCTLSASQLRPGTYHLVATYAGATPFARSSSAKKTLTVTK